MTTLTYAGFGLSERQQREIRALMIWSELSQYTNLDLGAPIKTKNPDYKSENPEEQRKIDALQKELRGLEADLMNDIPEDLVVD